jgi:uncharacterized protein YggE
MHTRTLLTVAVLAFFLQLSHVGLAQEKNTITVSGTAKVEAKADIAYITLYIRADGILMVDAVKNAKQKVEQIQKALKEKHKEIKGIEVVDIEIGEKSKEYWSSEQKEEPPRPEVVKRMRITIAPDPALAYQVIDTAIRAGAIMQIPSSVHYSDEIRSVVMYGLLDASKREDEVRKKALEDAEKNAKETATLVGKKIGDVVSVGCSESGFWPQSLRIMGREAEFPVKHLGLDPEKIEISHSLKVTYELLKK